MKSKTFTMSLFYDNTYLGSFKTITDDPEKIYKMYGESTIREGFNRGHGIPYQKKRCQKYMKDYEKNVRHCMKIKASSFIMLLACFFISEKFEDDKCQSIFLKNKKKVKNKI